MPTKHYALEEDGPKDLTIAWTGGGMKDFTVTWRGSVVGTHPGLRADPVGVTFTLPNGRQLFAKWTTATFGAELMLLIDGQPVPGSAGHPVSRVRAAAGVGLFVAGANALFGVIAMASRSEVLAALGGGLPSLFTAAVFGTLAWFMWKRASLAAIWVAIVLYGADAIYTVGAAISSETRVGIGGLVLRVMLLTILARAIPAAKELALKKPKLPTTSGGSTGAPAPIPVALPKKPD